TASGHCRVLPRCTINGRFTSISRHNSQVLTAPSNGAVTPYVAARLVASSKGRLILGIDTEASSNLAPDLKRPWEAVARRAGLDGVRLHDLRHAYASFGAGGGLACRSLA